MKDYYRILGVLDDAEDIIIRASYKALAQRYHPDKWKGDKEEANKKMQDINEAYETLSDTNKRKKYDEEYFKYREGNEANFSDVDDEPDISNEQDEAWDLAVDFYPIIAEEYAELKCISSILANTFRNHLISNQEFKNSTYYKNKYEVDYLNRFYGHNADVQKFAKNLLLNGHSKAAIKLNKIIRLLGNNVSYEQIYQKINQEFFPRKDISKNWETSKRKSKNDELLERAKLRRISGEEVIFLLKREFGAKVNQSLFGSKNEIKVTFEDGTKKVLTITDAIDFIIQNLN